ncbi:MAG TPA: hypothetical protein VFV08_10285, partial [Puia sp.]|nr:hypothetical protein [Puia sp.]
MNKLAINPHMEPAIQTYTDATVGGILLGRTHQEGGIKLVNKDTGQPLEAQNNEVIVNAAAAMAPGKNNTFNGKPMTNLEILSAINTSRGNGVSFLEEGGKLGNNYKCICQGNKYDFNGVEMHDYEIAQTLCAHGNVLSERTDYLPAQKIRILPNGKLLQVGTVKFLRGGPIKRKMNELQQEIKTLQEEINNTTIPGKEKVMQIRQLEDEYYELCSQQEKELGSMDIPNEVKAFMPLMQQKAIVGSTDHWDVIDALKRNISDMPRIYDTKDIAYEDKIVYLHYFYGQSDWYIVEKDNTTGMQQAFGYIIPNGDIQNARWSCISIKEIKETNKIELDFDFEPIKFGELQKDLATSVEPTGA